MKIVRKHTTEENGMVHTLVEVETRGRVYAIIAAPGDYGDVPTDSVIKQWWTEDRRSFRPFDQVYGRFCK